MAERNLNDIPSDEELFYGFPKNPYVSLERVNVIPFLNNIKIKHDNGKLIPYLEDKTKSCILRKILRNCSVALKNIGLNNNNRVSKRNRRKKNNLNVTNISKKRGRKPKTIKKHVRSSNNKEINMNQKQYKCKKCKKIFNESKSLNEHMKLKHKKQVYVCAHCSKKYVRRIFFKRHIGLHCEKCFALQRNHLQYMDHIILCQNENIDENQSICQKFLCDLCTDEFTSKCVMTYHRLIVHSNSSPKEFYMIRSFGATKVYTCNFCEECYDDKNLIESHVSILQKMSLPITNNTPILDDMNCVANNNVEKPPQQISKDPPQQISKDPVISTLENVKEEMANTTLDICENANVDIERSPINNNRILRYHCKMCDKYFLTNFALIRHIKVHHILQTLSCNLCKQAFTEVSMLRLHQCTGEPTTPVSAKPEIDAVPSPPFIPPAETGKCNIPVLSDMRTMQKDLVYNIVVREVPIEF